MQLVRTFCNVLAGRRLSLGNGVRQEAKISESARPLRLMSLNLQYYASFPDDVDAGRRKLFEVIGMDDPSTAVDVIAVQEGVASRNELEALGFRLVVCSGAKGQAQSVREMVYSDAPTVKACPEKVLDELLCNQLYVRRGSPWAVVDSGAERISSGLALEGGEGRCAGPLAVRSVAWARLRCGAGPDVLAMSTHISGGRFEDQYFVQQLAGERRGQVQHCIDLAERLRASSGGGGDLVSILAGDFNAVESVEQSGPMHCYFASSLETSPGVQADAAAARLEPAQVEPRFMEYMVSPFKALREAGWTFAYGAEVGVTSAFGHLIDHIATSRRVRVQAAEVMKLTNQRFGGGPPDTDTVVTDHNAVRVTFLL